MSALQIFSLYFPSACEGDGPMGWALKYTTMKKATYYILLPNAGDCGKRGKRKSTLVVELGR